MKIKVNGKILTFCGKCHKEISCEEIIKIKEKVLICKECSQKTTVMCYGCSLPIFKHELVYEVSEGWNIGSESRSTDLIQCCSCYEIWLIDTNQKKSSLKWIAWSNEFSLLLITYSLTILAFALAWEPKSISSTNTKKFLISTSYLSLFFNQILFPFLKLILIWKEERKENKRIEKKIKKMGEEIERLRKKSKKQSI